ncbi:hypothetical protein EHP00_1113 [Ecytonucleospora hepatopenaei]|uniref:ISXO2-like transposase domain-containing protein n=1 Tax=Ecytonucleospora hepatopenaei TaxID=646526 RepID=A0A1W0E4Y4_9MICR|nr:hypothetical protein EHP00_1113 [Ecytonucleospora hepatopenaei]
MLFLNTSLVQISTLLQYKLRNLKNFIKSINDQIKNIYERFTDRIGGSKKIVKIDESKFGKRKYNKGHHVERVWVLGMVERTPERRMVFISVKNRNKETL